MRKQRVTLKQVAKLAGVSSATASMILNRRQSQCFAEKTVHRVEMAAEALGYALDEAPASPRPALGSQKGIAVFLPDVTGNYYASIAYAIDYAAQAKGLDTIHFVCYRDKDRELRSILSLPYHPVEGVIFTYVPHNYELVEKLSATLPTVVIGHRDARLPSLDMIETDGYRAGALLARHMLALGHRNVAFIAPQMKWWGYSSAQRIQGVVDTFKQECPEAKLVYKTQLIPGGVDLQRDMTYSRQRLGYTLTAECLSEDRSLTGFIGVNDYVAYGIIDALHAHGFRVPEDFSVCGCDDVFASGLSGISLTTVNHHVKEKCLQAFDLLYRKMVSFPTQAGEAEPTSITRIEYLSSLVARQSTAPPRKHELA